VSSAQPFVTVVKFLRRKLGIKDAGDSIFCYVNQCFAPGLDEGVGGLWAVSDFFISIYFLVVGLILFFA